MNIRKYLAVLLIVMGMTGCAAPRDRGYVQREWSMVLHELGIAPIFPPREDVMVGDIYAYDYNPDSDKARKIFETKWSRLTEEEQKIRLRLGRNPRMARLSPQINNLIQEEYSKTISAPATTSEYNSILGNPVLASANDKVKTAEAKLKKLKDKVTVAKKAASDAQKNLSDATRVKQDKDAAVTKAEEKLNAAKTTPPDTSVQEAKLKAAKADVRLKEDAVTRAERAIVDAGDDPVKKAEAEKKKLQADRDKADADVAVLRAQEDLDSAKLVRADVPGLQLKLSVAKKEQQAAADEIIKLQRISEDKTAAATAMEQKQAGPIEKATKAVATAKEIRKAIAMAGVKMLYSQPRDAKSNIYTVENLPNPKGGADDLKNSRVNRLRLVAFPDFVTTTFSQGDLAALIPVEAMMVGLNISSTNVAKVSVKIPAAESYALSLDKIIGKIVDVKVNSGRKVWKLKEELNDATEMLSLLRADGNHKKSDGGSTSENNTYLRVVTEVFYARAMDITLFSANSFGSRVQVAPPVPVAGTAASPTASPTAVAPINSPVAGSASATDMLTSIQNRLAMTQTLPGGSVQVVSYSDQSIGMRRVFDRPIAIGYRGLALTVDSTGVITDVGPGVGPTSMFLDPSYGSN